ncbi:MAG TPA: redoxin domain-containing protein [Sedimentisphaerales bacterium]|nr:redoxin domain-containing protein [Sedimentisphaerales bacterium]HRS11892.1 redoxin domain-containing protein [Sedimentisphaerales bacterium]HRV48569.1 redoxin domain-containing protein [Sedimentisphaerales bacterium]
MVRPDRVNWLDEAIARTAPGWSPVPDFDAWRSEHAHALETLTQRAQRKAHRVGPVPAAIAFGRELMRNPLIRLAAAALLAVAVFILVRHLSRRETATPTSERQIVETAMHDQTTLTADAAQAELIRAEGLFRQSDVSGLLTLMETGRYGTKVKIAGYLERIGNASALSALEPLAAQWQGAPDTNPFRKAIDAIHRREKPAAEREPARAEPNAVSEQQPEGAPSSRSERSAPQSPAAPAEGRELVTYAGRVVDETDDAVPGVHVWGQVLSNTFRNSVLAQETLTDTDGRFHLTTARPVEGTEILRVLYFDHADYGLGWHTLAGSDADESIQVTLYAPGAVAGVVVDRLGQPVADARIEADMRLSANGQTDQLMLWDLTHKYVYADTSDGDMQIFPQGWQLLGRQAPPLSIAKWYNSKPQTLEELRGKVVLLQIGVLLPLYGEDLTMIQKVAEKYAGRGLEIIAVHQSLDVTWGGEVTEDDLQKLVRDGHVPFAFCLDQKRQTCSAYAPKATPALYLIDREGRVVISPTKDNIETCIDQLLGR